MAPPSCRRRPWEIRICAAVLVAATTHSCSSVLFISVAPFSASCHLRDFLLRIPPTSLHHQHLATTMPSDSSRVTRSGRVTKQTSKSSLTADKSPATSNSRSRTRDKSANTPTSRSQRRPQTNPSSAITPARAAVIEDLIAQERQRVDELEAEEADPEDGRMEVLDTLMRRREALEASKPDDSHHGRSPRRSHRRRRSQRSSSTSSSSSSKPRVSFRGVSHHQGKTLRSSIQTRFPAVASAHFKHIYNGTFEIRHLLQLANTNAAPISKEANKIESTNKLLRCIEIYCQIVCHFTSPAAAVELQQALASFRIRVLEFLDIYTFQTVRDWSLAFISTRITKGQDDALGWLEPAVELAYKLVPRPKMGGIPLRPAPASPGTRPDHICRNFNKGSCMLAFCKYQHVCNVCGQNHPATRCQKAASGSNTTPLADRVQRP